MIEVEVRNRNTHEIQFCWGYSVEGALAQAGYSSPAWEVIHWEFID